MSAARHIRIWRVLWAVIVAAPLCAWLVLAACTLEHQPRVIATGDALIDAVFLAVLDADPLNSCREPKCPVEFSICGLFDAEYIPEVRWQELEARFATDSRFWVLCFQNRTPPSRLGKEYDSPRLNLRLPASYFYLEQAREHGVDNTLVKALLFREVYEIYLQRYLDQPGPRMKDPRGCETKDSYQRFVFELSHRHLPALADELMQGGAQRPQDNLLFVRLASAEGRQTLAFEYLQRYLAAPQAETGTGSNWLEDAARATNDDLFTYGMSRSVCSFNEFTHSISLRLFLHNNLERMVAEGDAEQLALVQQVLCKVVADPGCDSFTKMPATRALDKLAALIQSKWPRKLDQAQATALADFALKATQLKQVRPNLGSGSSPFPATGFSWPYFRLLAAEYATRGRAYYRLEFLESAQYYESLRAMYDGPMRKQAEELARFDFTTFAWRDGAP